MSEDKRQGAQLRFLLTNLGVLLIFILALLLVLAAYPVLLAPGPTRTPTVTRRPTTTLTPTRSPTITLSPTPSRTPRPTFTPTITLTPTRTLTPTVSPTLPGPPTLTPARPVIGQENYSLHPWTVERAAQLLALIEDYPNTLPRQSRGPKDENYYAAFRYAALAHAEAVLRFPNAPEAVQWRWARAFDLARMGDLQAGQVYADLVAAGLNRGDATIFTLPDWFLDHEPRLALRVFPLDQLPGYLSANLVQVEGSGSAFFLVLESGGGFQALSLASWFDYVNSPSYRAFASDLTGDGTRELVFYQEDPGLARPLALPVVFDISQDTPVQLQFQPLQQVLDVGVEYENRWFAANNISGQNTLRFQAQIFPACPLDVTLSYAWNGSWFVIDQTLFKLNPAAATLGHCQRVVEHAAARWGARTALVFAEQLLPVWPPLLQESGDPYPPDALDEWRFRIALYHALAGDSQAAVQQMEAILTSPTVPSSRWIAAAQDFLAAYNQPADLYRGCLTAQACSPRQALQLLLEDQPLESYPQIQTRIRELGASLRTTGYFDFDGDGVKEIWFTLRHRPGEKLEFWFLMPHPQGIRAFFLDAVDSNLPELSYYQEEPLPPTVLLQNRFALRVERMPDTLEPYLSFPELPRFYPDRFGLALKAAEEALFSGVDPAQVQRQLLDIQDTPGLLCRAFFTCDEYYHMLGLAAELAGDKPTAIESYLQVWWDSSRSPFTTMVRLKLKGAAVLPSSTASLTPTTTATVTRTPTITGTPPTATITLTPTITPTETPYPEP